jgi:hypothetical protein
VARGNEKGRVERFIGFLRHSFFAARAFTSVADLNAQLARWIVEVAHARPVPDRREQCVAAALTETASFLPLPEHPFPEKPSAISSGQDPLPLRRRDYSIPHTLVRRPLPSRRRVRQSPPRRPPKVAAIANYAGASG